MAFRRASGAGRVGRLLNATVLKNTRLGDAIPHSIPGTARVIAALVSATSHRVTSALLGLPGDLVGLKDRALAGRADLRNASHKNRCGWGPSRVGVGCAIPSTSPRAAVWSGCARSTGRQTSPSVQDL